MGAHHAPRSFRGDRVARLTGRGALTAATAFALLGGGSGIALAGEAPSHGHDWKHHDCSCDHHDRHHDRHDHHGQRPGDREPDHVQGGLTESLTDPVDAATDGATTGVTDPIDDATGGTPTTDATTPAAADTDPEPTVLSFD